MPNDLKNRSSVDESVQKMTNSFQISKEVAEIYQNTKKAYQEETGADFSTGALQTTSVQLFHKLVLANAESGTGLLANYKPPSHNPIINSKPIKPTLNVSLEPKSISIVEHLQNELENINRRDEEWVKKHYSLKNTPEDQEFVAKTVEDYWHMAEFTKRLITALNMATDDEKNKNAFSKDLLNVVV